MVAIVLIVISVLLVVGFVLAIPAFKLKNEMYKKTGKYPVGHFMSQGIGLGIAIGMPIGMAIGNIAIGPAIGMGIGVAIGKGMEEKNKDKIRPLTKEEKELKKKKMWFLFAILVIGLIFFVSTFFVGIK
ncbi:hypothetical protein HOD20_05520 [archaeon]|jgi:hypothetical protein|nr:hypothetical protein [archaeon]MBT4351962.1 hypothetical protein [archaeon]MBT4646685.1 hypothetical protein [archaeon]MBT6821865.1 hypothetical protein [archaeon]MBT7392275.1 hypothetical protein [archaeon]